MTRHTGLRGRKAREMRSLNAGMTVAAIDAVVLYVMFMAKENGLLNGDADKRHPGAAVYRVPQRNRATHQYNHSRKRYSEDRIRAAAK